MARLEKILEDMSSAPIICGSSCDMYTMFHETAIPARTRAAILQESGSTHVSEMVLHQKYATLKILQKDQQKARSQLGIFVTVNAS